MFTWIFAFVVAGSQELPKAITILAGNLCATFFWLWVFLAIVAILRFMFFGSWMKSFSDVEKEKLR
jgi:hypothetical protein